MAEIKNKQKNVKSKEVDRKKEKIKTQTKGIKDGRRDSRKDSSKDNIRTSVKDRVKGSTKDISRSGLKCKISKKCGGCQFLDVPYEEQLMIKTKSMKSLLGKFGDVEPIIGMENPFHYRNKVHAVFHRKKDGTIISGVYEEGTHNVLPVTTCFIENKKADEIIESITKLLKSFKITIYSENSGYGLMRHVLIRTGHQSGEIMVVLVTASPIFPSKNNFVKALLKLHPEITTIVQNINEKQTNMVLGDREKVLYGKGYIQDTLCDKVFRISAKSFYQINPVQTELLYSKAIKLADLKNKETVIDAYCGIGTIGIIASKHAKEVIGVELNSDAIKDAKVNAKLNKVDNITFYNNDAGKFMVGLAEQGVKVDVVFMDPPRSGSDEAFMDSVIKLAPKKVVYISCGPDTLARDLEYMTKKGKYEVKKICPVDMFPMTGHVETIIMMTYCGDKEKNKG